MFHPVQASLSSQSPSEEKQEAGSSGEQTGRDADPSSQTPHTAEHNQDDPLEEETPSISSMYLPGKHAAFCVLPSQSECVLRL